MNLIGEHVDYVGGLVLPAAVDRYVDVAVGPADEWVLEGGAGGLKYVQALAEELGAGPLHVAVDSDVPQGAGLSSSAALLVATAATLAPELGGVEAARLCQTAEQRAAGVQVGIMDQFASALGRSGCAILLDCASLEHRYIPLPADLVLAVIDSGVSRELAATPYNERRAEAEAAVGGRGGDASERRLRHVLSEIKRVGLFVAALQAGDRPALGRLLTESHASLRDDFEVSTPELDALVSRADAAPGCLGARLMGAGFGGSVLALLEAQHVAAFEAAVGAPVLSCRPVDGAYQGSPPIGRSA